MNALPSWLSIERGQTPLIVSMPHTGTDIPKEYERGFASRWLALKDTDWWVDKLYCFAPMLGATIVRTKISRTIIDVNRDPSGKSLYPGQATTELCPTTTFDGESLYRDDRVPDDAEIAARRARWFDPYHAAIAAEVARSRVHHARVVLFDAHSIRSRIPRLFERELPTFNVGTNGGTSCAPALTSAIEAICDGTHFSRVTNGRFKGGYTTRHYGKPHRGIHAVQLELATRGYLDEPERLSADNWPPPFRGKVAARMVATLQRILKACIDFAREEEP